MYNTSTPIDVSGHCKMVAINRFAVQMRTHLEFWKNKSRRIMS